MKNVKKYTTFLESDGKGEVMNYWGNTVNISNPVCHTCDATTVNYHLGNKSCANGHDLDKPAPEWNDTQEDKI